MTPVSRMAGTASASTYLIEVLGPVVHRQPQLVNEHGSFPPNEQRYFGYCPGIGGTDNARDWSTSHYG